MTIQSLKSFKAENALTFKDLSKLFNVSPAAVQHWAYGVRSIPGPAMILFKLYANDNELIKKVLTDF